MSLSLDVSLPVFIGLTVVLFGGAAFLAGQAAANAWRPAWRVLTTAAMLGLGDRFLSYALFDGPLFTITGYLGHGVVLLALCWVGYRLTLARKMVVQYPWLYQRSGLFGWREISS